MRNFRYFIENCPPMLRRLCLCGIFLLFALSLSAQKVRTVSAEYIYYPPENVTLEQAKATAIERARLEAIANEFGTNVSQTNTIVISNDKEGSNTQYNTYGSTEVKGDWIADTAEPQVQISYEGGMLVIKVKVAGKVRERNSADIELDIATLCNGTPSESFKNNDKFAVRFKAAANGFLSIYLIDDNVEQAYCLLPYENENGMAREIEKGKTYTLLSTADPVYPYREETILTTEKKVDFNRLAIIFSTTRFAMPLTEQGAYVPELTSTGFERWLQKNRIKDESMMVIYKTLEIKK